MPQLLEQLAHYSEPPAWTAEASLHFEDAATAKSHDVGLRIAAARPDRLRLQGTRALLPTLFVMVANEKGLWLDVPSRRKTYLYPRGSQIAHREGISRTLLAFEPALLLSALVPAPPQPDELWSLEARPDSYELVGQRCGSEGLQPTRRLLFDRSRLELRELRLFDAEGRLTTSVRFSPRVEPGGAPSTVHIERPFDKIALSFEFRKFTPAQAPDLRFDFQVPRGRQLLDVSTDRVDDATPLGEDATR